MRTRTLLSLLLVGGMSLSALAGTYWKADFKADRTTGSTLEEKGWANLDINNTGKKFALRNTKYGNIDGVTVNSWEHPYDNAYLSGGSNLNPANHWIITPSLRFEAGKTYKATLLLAKTSHAEYTDIYEIKMGSAQSVAGMTTQLVPVSSLPEASGNSLWTKEVVISVSTTGDYYIGIHCCGELGSYASFGVADFEIEDGVATSCPAAVTDLKIIPDPMGDKKTTISFRTPKLAKDGTALQSLTKVEIKRNDQLVHTIDNPAVDTELSWTDTNIAANGVYSYAVVAYSAAGGGDIAETSAFVGINVPAAALQPAATAIAPWKARVTWIAPAEDKDGNPIAESLISYDLYRSAYYSLDREKIASDLITTSFEDTLTPVAPDPDDESVRPTPEREFYRYFVIAKTSTGSAKEVASGPVMLGQPYPFPYYESWPRGRASNLFTAEEMGAHTRWQPMTGLEETNPQDNDNGYLALSGAMNGWTVGHIGEVSLKDADSPVLSFYTYNLTGCTPGDNEFYVAVTSYDDNGQTLTRVYDTFIPENGWCRQFYPLDEFAGKTVTVDLYGHRLNSIYSFIDNLAISTIYPHDLMVNRVEAPKECKTDRPFTLRVDVHNAGTQPSGSYTMKLLADGVEVDSKSMPGLGVGLTETVEFNYTMGIDSDKPVAFSAEIVYADDRDLTNNSATLGSVTAVMPPYPVVTDLTATLNDGHGAVLNWGEPDTATAKDYPLTETWDSYPSWANKDLGEWTLVDRDEALIAGFAGKDMPGIPSYSEQSWWVFDNTEADFNNGVFEAWSGNKFLASMVSGFNSDNDKGKPAGFVDNDDWAISPLLAGSAQTITVNARSMNEVNGGVPESFEILWSDGSLNPDDFTSAAKFIDIESSWTPFTADLPDGARRFAIRNISNGKMLLMVDDVVYHGVANTSDFAINGYNVYRDGERLNQDGPIEAQHYVDNSCGDGNHDYTVTVCYAVGESLHSNKANPTKSGIGGVDASGSTLRIVGRYDLQGRTVGMNAAPGIYIERLSDGTARKVRKF